MWIDRNSFDQETNDFLTALVERIGGRRIGLRDVLSAMPELAPLHFTAWLEGAEFEGLTFDQVRDAVDFARTRNWSEAPGAGDQEITLCCSACEWRGNGWTAAQRHILDVLQDPDRDVIEHNVSPVIDE